MLRRNGQCMFLSIIGPTTYKLLSSMIAPDKPGEKSYEDLVKVLKEHRNPTPSEIVQRYKFHTRIRKPEESIQASQVSELWQSRSHSKSL